MSSAEGALLRADRLSKRFGAMRAVDAMSLALHNGEIVGLVGPNGAGKTTFFNLLAGSLSSDDGAIFLGGQDITSFAPYRRMSRGLGRTFQIPKPFSEVTLLENVMLAAQNQSGERIWNNWLKPRLVASEEQRVRDKAMDLLAFLTLDQLAGEPARILSGGQRKLLELARVLMADPRIILLDEPAAGVNPSLLEVIIDRIAEINARGITFLIIEHNMDLVARLCGRVVVMASGALLCAGTPDEVARNPSVIEAYLGGRAA